jgi:molybdate transport system substrate-binding protein
MGHGFFRNAAGTLMAAILACFLAGCRMEDTTSRGVREVRVAAAANLKSAFDEIAADFQKEHPDVRVSVTYGSSGNFFAQIINRAPFDLFLSADVDYPRQLVEQGQAGKDAAFVYAVGQIVVWVPNGSKLELEKSGIQVLADPSVRKVAIANPKHAPYGRAAQAAMKQLGVFNAVQDRLVLGENIEQTAMFVDSGAADVGIIALSQALSPALRDKGRYWVIPRDAYPALEQGGVILSGAKDPAAAEELRRFLLGSPGRSVLKRHGYSIPKD